MSVPVDLSVSSGITVLADNNFGDTVPGGLAGPLALLFVVLLAVGTVLLIRNMNSRLRRLPASFDRGAEPAGRDTGNSESSGETRHIAD